jgi:exosortase
MGMSLRLPRVSAPAWPDRFTVATAVLFAVAFARPMQLLVRDWLTDPDMTHGLLLAPLAVWLAWRAGRVPDARPRVLAGALILVLAMLLRYVSDLAAELFTMRLSMLLAGAGLVVFHTGWRQLARWWLPATLLLLSVPLPATVLSSVALPLQLLASRIGAAILATRHVPVLLDGNVIRLPGHELFVTEACSGLRSLLALLALGVLIGGMMLRTAIGRALLVGATIPIAILINGARVFITGFLVYYVDGALGQGFMHATEGWLMFVVAFAVLSALAFGVAAGERMVSRRGTSDSAGAGVAP